MIKDNVKLTDLNKKDAELAFLADTAVEVKTFWTGGRLIEAQRTRYIQPKVDETPQMFQVRKERFVYTNIFAALLNQFLSRFAAGNVAVQSPENPVLANFRDKLPENIYLTNLLRDLLLNKTVYVQVDKKRLESGLTPSNLLAERVIDVDLLTPYIVQYTPEEILSEAEDGSWYKFRIFRKETTPFDGEKLTAIWRYIDSQFIVEYSAEVELDVAGNIKKVNGKVVDSDTTIPLTKFVEHNVGVVPVLKLELPDEKYIGGQVLLKLRQYLMIENNLTDAALTAGYVQRVYTPFTEKVDDYAALETDELEELKTSNAYVIKAERFKFEEISGSSIKVLAETLNQIESQIANLICATTTDVTKTSLNRSAASKLVDDSHIEAFVRSYGRYMNYFYQQILQLAGLFVGIDDVESIQVLGLESFETNSLMLKIEEAEKLISSGVAEQIDLKLYWQTLETELYTKLNKGTID